MNASSASWSVGLVSIGLPELVLFRCDAAANTLSLVEDSTILQARSPLFPGTVAQSPDM